MKGFATRAIHMVPQKKDAHGALRMPVYHNAAFEFETSSDLQLAFEGRKVAHVYSRSSNPTVEDYEQRVRALADAATTIAVSSGMAAIFNVILALAETGSNIVSSPYLFGNTYSLFATSLKPWGLDARFADFSDIASVEKAIDSSTRALFFESITNPQMQVADVAELSRIAKQHGIPLIVDGTLTTPYLFKSRDFGVDVEVLSATKYISGGGTSVGGLILDHGTFDWSNHPKMKSWHAKYGPQALTMYLRRELYRNMGSCISPQNAFLQGLGLETLGLRIARSCANALEVAQFLEKSNRVGAVLYPGLSGSPYHAIACRQFLRGFGGIVTFELKDRAQAFAFMDKLQLVKRATNVCDNKSLIIHPASTIYVEFPETLQTAMGINDQMIRLSLGIEDVEDLLEDLTQALETM
jgi:O-acetylhomoserine (thiol)-lyase